MEETICMGRIKIRRTHLLSRSGSSNIFKSLLTVALLAVVFIFGAGVITYLAVRGRTVAVPNVVGKLKAAAGAVTDQSPSAGTIVKTGQIVRVGISRGAAPAGQNAQK